MNVNNSTAQVQERREYVKGFNGMMIKIWQEQIVKLDAIRTGQLYRSVVIHSTSMDAKVVDVHLSYNFVEYGVYVDRGTGRETPRGNPGDIGRAKLRQPKPWMSKKFFKSFFNIRNFFADSLGREFCAVVPKILNSSKF